MDTLVSSTPGTMRKGVVLDTPSRTITSRVTYEFSAVTDDASAAFGMSKSEFIRRSLRALYRTLITVMQESMNNMGGVQSEVSMVEGVETF